MKPEKSSFTRLKTERCGWKACSFGKTFAGRPLLPLYYLELEARPCFADGDLDCMREELNVIRRGIASENI